MRVLEGAVCCWAMALSATLEQLSLSLAYHCQFVVSIIQEDTLSAAPPRIRLLHRQAPHNDVLPLLRINSGVCYSSALPMY